MKEVYRSESDIVVYYNYKTSLFQLFCNGKKYEFESDSEAIKFADSHQQITKISLNVKFRDIFIFILFIYILTIYLLFIICCLFLLLYQPYTINSNRLQSIHI